MAIQTPQNYAGYESDILTALSNTGIRQLAPGGKARAFGDIVANELAELESRQFANIAQSLLPFATDVSLDLIGEIFGVPRLTAQNASVDITEQNFEWYVRNGTFGSINSGQDIVIPAGVQIYTAAQNGPVYTLSTAVTCPAGASSQYFSATSLLSGAAGNAASGIFCLTNFTGYTESAFGSLLVTNNYGIVTGADAETDDNYRYRIQLKIQSPNGANEAALRFQLLLIPGIQDVVFSPAAGTFTCYVYGIASDGSSALLQSVQTALNDNIAFPLTGIAVAPDLVGISLTTTITLTTSLSPVDQQTVIANAMTAVENAGPPFPEQVIGSLLPFLPVRQARNQATLIMLNFPPAT
jgi:phage-related baseplate assembly protein